MGKPHTPSSCWWLVHLSMLHAQMAHQTSKIKDTTGVLASIAASGKWQAL